jgi:hypothetical protein
MQDTKDCDDEKMLDEAFTKMKILTGLAWMMPML